MKSLTTKVTKKHEAKNIFEFLRVNSCSSWLLIICLFVVGVAEAKNAVPGKKARLYQITVTDNQLPVVFDSQFAVLMKERHVQQLQQGKKFYVRYNVYIFDGTTLVRTLTKDEEILLPLNFQQLPKNPPPDSTCDGAPEPLQRPQYGLEPGDEPEDPDEEKGSTKPFAIIPSNLQWDGKDENGDPVSSANLLYRLEADWIRINSSNNKVKILGTIIPHCASLTIDTGAPVIEVNGVTDGEYRSTTATIVITITDESGIAKEEILLDGVPFESGSTVSEEGHHLLHVSATDTLGNTATKDVQFTIDVTPPQIIFAVPPYINADVTLSPQIIDANAGTTTILLNGQEVPEGTILAQDGAYDLQITARDLAGNSSVLAFEFTIDKTAPVITTVDVEDGKFYASPVAPIVQIVDVNLESSSILLDGQPFESGTTVDDEGAHTLVVTALDRAGNSANSVVNFGVDTIAPQVKITNPEDGDLFHFDSIQVSGTFNETNLKNITLNGNQNVTAGGGQFFASTLLQNGSNNLVVVATDLAGNTAQDSITVTLDQTPPGIAINNPQNGAVLIDNLIDVIGTVSGSDIDSVTVNGIAAALSGDDFSAHNVLLSSGLNTIHAIATDQAGNTQEATIQVTLDIEGPSITFTHPVNNSVTTADSTVVSGFVFDLTAATLTINGVNVTLQPDGSFQTTISLNEGVNAIIAVATDQNGNSKTAQIHITRDSTPPTVVSITPADGSTSVPVDQIIEIQFSESVKSSTINSTSITFQSGGNTLQATLQTNGDRVILTPVQPLTGANTYTVTVLPGIADLAGNISQTSASSTFSTFDTVPPAPPVVDPPLPQVTSEPTIMIAGTAEAGSLVEITGGVARVTTNASELGIFSAEVSLFIDAVNQISITAKDLSGNISNPTTATILQDSIRMVVQNATYQIDGTILIEFTKPVDLNSITPQNLYVVASGIINGTVSATANPATILFTPDTPLGSSPFLLKVEASVHDQSGQPLEYAFSKIFNTAGGSFVLGEVYDNYTGLPLPGAIVRQISPIVNPAPEATCDLNGQFTLPVAAGNLLLRIERAGYLTVDRFVNAPTAQAVSMFDARLQPQDSALLEITNSAGTLSNSDGSVSLNVVAGTVVDSADVRLTSRDGQSLPQILPEGWSPVGVAMIDTQATPQLPFTLRVRNDFQIAPNTAMNTAYFDSASSVWRLGPSGVVSADGQTLEVETQRTGTHTFVIPDFNNPPPPAVPDQPLQPSSSPQQSLPGTPSFVSTPEGVYPDQRARVEITFNGTQFRSGTKYQAIISEDYKLLGELGEVITIPRTADLIGYSNGQISSGLIRFYAAPAKAIDFSQLDSGFINVAIHAFPALPPPTDIIDENGGTVNSAEGDLHLQIPAGALTGPVPVILTSLDPQSIHLPLPDYNLITAFEVSFSGAVLLLPATLDGPASLPADPQLIVARLVQVGLASYWVVEGTAVYDGNRINTIAGPGSAPGIRSGGIYGIFHAQLPIGFLTGTITNPQSNPAGPGIVVSSSANPLRALSSTASLYTLAVPVGSATATANNTVSGDSGSAPYTVGTAAQIVTLNIQIVTTPPQILSITPAAGATNVPQNTIVRVTFSEPVLASSVNSSSLFLQNVTATILLTSNNTIAILTPTTPLSPNTQYTLSVTSPIKDLTGNALSNPVSNHIFTTVDNTPPETDGNFKLFLPEGPNAPNEGIVRFEVDSSQIEPGISLVFFNETQQTSISATLQNGKYIASIAGRITDAFFVMMIDAAGNQTRIDLPLMQYPDGKGAAFKTEGGTFVTAENIEITVQPGTFDSITPVRLETIQIPDEELPPHDDYLPLQHFTLNLNGATARKEIEIAVPIPDGITEDSQVFVMKPVEFFSRRKWMAMEIMKIVDGKLRTQSPPWPGIQEQAITSGDGYSITAASAPMYFLQGSVGSLPAVLEFSNSDLAILLFNSLNWILPLQINEPYTLTVSNPVTGETLFSGQPAPPATEMNGIVQLQTPVSADHEAPYVIGGTPLTFASWRIGAATGLIRNNITFAASDSNGDGVADIEGNISIAGNAGALSKGAFVAIRNNRTGQQANAIAADDGSFLISSLPYQFSDPLTILLSSTQVELNSPLRLQWNEPLNTESDFKAIELCELDASGNCAATIPFIHRLLSSQTLLEIKPSVALESNKNYKLVLTKMMDLSEIEMPQDFELRFRTHDFGTSGEGSNGIVNDTFLLRNHLLVAKDTGIEVYDLANPFSFDGPVATLPLLGGVRSFARLGACTIGSISSTDCVVVVGGGVDGHAGMLRILNFETLNAPAVMKDFVVSRFVGDASDDPPNGVPNPIPEGRPIKVLVKDLKAYVANIGVGVQIIDLARLDVPVHLPPHSTVDEPNLKDVAIYMKDSPQVLDVLMSGLSMHSLVDIDFDGDLDSIPVSFKAAKAQSLSEVTHVESGVLAGIDNNLEVFQDFEIEIDGVKQFFDLGFIGSGSCGIHVLNITCLSSNPPCTSAPLPLGTIYLGTGPTNGGCGDSVSVFDLKLDRKNKRLYVPAGGAGIYIVDISDPFLIDHSPSIASQVIGHIEFQDGTIADGEVTIDEELNTVYVATKDGFKSVLTGNLHLGIFTALDDDGKVDDQVGFVDSEGIIKDHATGEPWLPGTKLTELQDQDPIKYYVIAYLPSAAGANVKVNLQSTNFFDQPLKLAAGFPDTQIDLQLHYQPASDQQQSYRLYQSDAFYITAHPLLPSAAKKENPNSKVIAAGDLIKVSIDSVLGQKLSWVNDDLLQRSVASARTIRLDYIDTENPEPKQNPAMGSGETAYPPYLHSGEFTMSAVDLSIKGRGFDYVFARKYESQSLYDGPLGVGWDHPYNARIMELPSGHVFYFDGMGRKEFYRFLGENDPLCAKEGETKLCYLPAPGNFVLLAKGRDGLWQLQESDGTYRLFDQFGRLEKIQDRYGNRIEMQYSPQGQLDVVVDTMGRPITYIYNDDGKLISVRDFSNPTREWKFNYDENVASPDRQRATHLLTSVETPKPLPSDTSGRITRYEYQNPTANPQELSRLNLSTMTDPRGNKLLQNTYDPADDQLIAQQYGKSGETIIFNYQQTAPPSTLVTDRRGTVTEYEFGAGVGNNQNNLLSAMTEELESGSLKTEFTSYDAHGLLLTAKIPGGDLITMKYQGSAQNLNDVPNTDFRNHGNLLESDYKGVNEGGGESQNPLKNFYDYAGSFNILQAKTDPGGHVIKTIEFKTKGSSLQLDPKTIQYEEGVIEKSDYNDFGQLTNTIDGEEHKNEYEYYPETGAATIRPGTDPDTGGYLRFKKLDVLGSDLTWEYVYDIRGNVIEIKNPRGFSTKYVYNSLDELIEQTDGVPEINTRVRMSYDKNGNTIEVSSERELELFSSIKYEYGILNQVEKKLEQVDGRDLETSYLYDPNYNLIEVTFPQGNKASYVYDKRDDKIQENIAPNTPAQQRTFYNYDKNRNLISVIDDHDPPHSTVLVYDNEDRHTATIYSEGNVSERIYDADGLVSSESVYENLEERQANNPFARTQYEYDGLHRLDKKLEDIRNGDPGAPLQLQTDYRYNHDNLLTAIIDPKQRESTIAYDGVHREIEKRDPAGNAVSFTYGDKLNATEIIQNVAGTTGSHISNAQYHNRNRSFDALNRLIGEEDDLGHRKQYAYDFRGNLKLVADPVGTSAASYDDLNRKKSENITTGNGPEISKQYFYDDNSRLSQVVDARNQTTNYGYDEANRLSSIQYPGGATENRQYDQAGNLKLVVDRNLSQVTYNYDSDERLIGKVIVPGTGVGGTHSQNFGYDAMNRMTSASDEDSNVQLTIDSRGLIWEDTQKNKNVGSRFDQVANKIRVDYPDDLEPLQREYHSNIDRLLRLGTNNLSFRQSEWLGIARESDRILGNGLSGLMNYDADGRLSELKHDPAGKVAGFGYQWDSAHFRTAESLTHHNNVANTFTLDRAHRINRATLQLEDGPIERNPNYDAADNITSVGGDEVASYVVGNQNQYVSDSDEQFAYDANGNLTSYTKGNTSKQYVFDYSNRMISAQITRDGDTHSLQFEYDPLGRRSARVEDSNRTEYVYDGAQIIQERNSSGDVTREYIWGDDIDELVAIQQSGNTYYPHENSLGSVAAITDQTGHVVERYDYDLFGAPVITKDDEAPCVSRLTRSGDVLTVEFCEEIDEAEVSQSDIRLFGAVAGDIPFSFAIVDGNLVISPSQALPNESVTMEISGIADLFGNVLGTTFSQTFDPQDQGVLFAGGSETGPVVVERSTIGNPFLFQGREWDPIAGLYYYRARYYDPHLMRFLSVDPTSYSDSPNLYQAFLNNPISNRDPLGLWICPKGQSCIGPTATEGIYEPYNYQNSPLPDEPGFWEYVKGGFMAIANAMTGIGVAYQYGVHPDPADTYHLYYHPTTKQQEQGMYATDIGIYAAPFVYKGFKAVSRMRAEAVEAPELSTEPWRRGVEAHEYAGKTKYLGYKKARPFKPEVDFKDLFGLENVEYKTMDLRLKSYQSATSLEGTLIKYRNQLFRYDKTSNAPLNILEINLMDKPEFFQDAVLRRFVQESAKRGVIVEIYDYRTGKMLIQPPGPVTPTEPK
jgi:RHS repeat-associated protein